jgi:hypothetical protein
MAATANHRTIEYFPRCLLVHDEHMVFNVPYIYYYITDLCRKQAEATQNYENANVCNRGHGEARQKILEA